MQNEKKIPVVEVFGPTIEGEGALIGTQTIFIRFGLCDYKCVRCDSMHAVDPRIVSATAMRMTCAELVTAVMDFQVQNDCTHIKHITLSGGNPAIHDLTAFLDLLPEDYKVGVETQGTKSPSWLLHPRISHVAVSPKSPGMGEVFKLDVFLRFIAPLVAAKQSFSIKIVAFSALDLEFAAGVYEECRLLGIPDTAFYLSLGNDKPPAYSLAANSEGENLLEETTDSMSDIVPYLLARYRLMLGLVLADTRLSNVRFLPQLHTLVWGNEMGN